MVVEVVAVAVVSGVTGFIAWRLHRQNAQRRLDREVAAGRVAAEQRAANPPMPEVEPWREAPNVRDDRWLNDLGYDGGTPEEQRPALVRQWVRRSHPDGADR